MVGDKGISNRGLLDTDASVSRREFARLVGISERSVCGLVDRGIIDDGQPVGEWLTAYLGNLRQQAASRAADLAEERAGLAREQKHLARIKKAKLLGEFAPVANLTLIVETVVGAMAKEIPGITAGIQRRVPSLSPEQLEVISAELIKARSLLLSVAGKEAVGRPEVLDVDPTSDEPEDNPAYSPSDGRG